eukprot:5229220-Lingulodinium_polyedra.AAC.1
MPNAYPARAWDGPHPRVLSGRRRRSNSLPRAIRAKGSRSNSARPTGRATQTINKQRGTEILLRRG